MRKALLIPAAAAVAAATAIMLRRTPEAPAQAPAGVAMAMDSREASSEADAARDAPGDIEPSPAEGMPEDEEDALADAFDALTDRWTLPSETAATLEDVEAFVEQFRKVPRKRRGECLQRALNLLPDENAMLLVGILMDKTLDRATAMSVFADIVNRGDVVKNPVLRQILADESHPCHDDAAWIFEVTGEKPEME